MDLLQWYLLSEYSHDNQSISISLRLEKLHQALCHSTELKNSVEMTVLDHIKRSLKQHFISIYHESIQTSLESMLYTDLGINGIRLLQFLKNIITYFQSFLQEEDTSNVGKTNLFVTVLCELLKWHSHGADILLYAYWKTLDEKVHTMSNLHSVEYLIFDELNQILMPQILRQLSGELEHRESLKVLRIRLEAEFSQLMNHLKALIKSEQTISETFIKSINIISLILSDLIPSKIKRYC
jgi:hypothetical protein